MALTDKLRVAQLVKTLLFFYGTKWLSKSDNNRLLVLILIQLNSIHAFIPYGWKNRFNIILLSTLRSAELCTYVRVT